MKIAIISDVHISSNLDQQNIILNKFFDFCINQKYNQIILLGDIFDFMCGFKKEYINKYESFFNSLKKVINSNIEVIYFEGNHDFNLKELFHFFIVTNNLNSDLFSYRENGHEINFKSKKVYISHGDDLDKNDYLYRIYKIFIRSFPIKVLMNNILQFNQVERIGAFLASKSKKHNEKKPSNDIIIKEAYRLFALDKAKNGFDTIISGHCHVKDEFIYDKNNIRFKYLNNGFALSSKTFIHLDENLEQFITID